MVASWGSCSDAAWTSARTSAGRRNRDVVKAALRRRRRARRVRLMDAIGFASIAPSSTAHAIAPFNAVRYFSRVLALAGVTTT